MANKTQKPLTYKQMVNRNRLLDLILGYPSDMLIYTNVPWNLHIDDDTQTRASGMVTTAKVNAKVTKAPASPTTPYQVKVPYRPGYNNLDRNIVLARQNEMIQAMNNGWDYKGTFFGKADGTADGLWGKNSRAAWNEYQKYKAEQEATKQLRLSQLQEESAKPMTTSFGSRVSVPQAKTPLEALDASLNITGNNRNNLSPVQLAEVRSRAMKNALSLNKFGGVLNYFDII